MRTIVLIALFSLNAICSDKNLEDIVALMRTKVKPNYLSAYEWKVLLYINYVRMFPKDFAEKELIPYSKEKYTDLNSKDYIDYVKPAIDRLQGKANSKNNVVKNKQIGKVGLVEPSLAYTLAERDFLSDPKRNSHIGSIGGWDEYAKPYLEINEEAGKYFPKDVYMSSIAEIAWPILPKEYGPKEVVMEWLIDRGNPNYGHREIILTFGGKVKVGVAVQEAPSDIRNKNLKGTEAIHIGFGVSFYEDNGLSIEISKDRKDLDLETKNTKLPFILNRKPSR